MAWGKSDSLITRMFRTKRRQVSSQTVLRAGTVSAVAGKESEAKTSFLRESQGMSTWCIMGRHELVTTRNTLHEHTSNKKVSEHVHI